jgi:polar amino acid transport system substrate-binding protein
MNRWPALLGLLIVASCVSTPRVPGEALRQLAPSGELRAAVNYGNPMLATRDAATGELRGVAVELGRELGRRLRVPVAHIGYATVVDLLAGLEAGEWDVAFLAVDPARRGEIDFTSAYMEVENTYLVPGQSDLRHANEVDRPGVRIAVQAGNAADLFLTRELRHASLVRGPDEAGALALVKDGSADTHASGRHLLLLEAAADPAYRVVEGRFSAIPHAVGVPAGHPAAAAYLGCVIEELKRSGFIRRMVDASGNRGVVVAPPAGGAC